MIPLGVCNHSPDYITHWLKKVANVSLKNTFMVAELLPETTKNKALLFLSPSVFKHHLPTLNTTIYDNTLCFVFGSPVDLMSFDIIPLDYSLSENVHLDAFQFTPIQLDLLHASPVQVKYTKHDFLDIVLEKVQSFNGILTQLMTFIYQIRPSTHQAPVKEMVCQWLVSDETADDLDVRIKKNQQHAPISEKQIQRLRTIATSEVAELYRQALKATKHITDLDSPAFYKIVTKMKVSAYEIRYIRAVTK